MHWVGMIVMTCPDIRGYYVAALALRMAPKSWGEKKEVVLEHNNKKISCVPGMTKEMMGRTADDLTSTL